MLCGHSAKRRKTSRGRGRSGRGLGRGRSSRGGRSAEIAETNDLPPDESNEPPVDDKFAADLEHALNDRGDSHADVVEREVQSDLLQAGYPDFISFYYDLNSYMRLSL